MLDLITVAKRLGAKDPLNPHQTQLITPERSQLVLTWDEKRKENYALGFFMRTVRTSAPCFRASGMNYAQLDGVESPSEPQGSIQRNGSLYR